MTWFVIWFGISNTCGGMRSNVLGQNRKIDEKYNEDCVEEGIQLAKTKLDRNGAGGRKALGTGNCSSNI